MLHVFINIKFAFYSFIDWRNKIYVYVKKKKNETKNRPKSEIFPREKTKANSGHYLQDIYRVSGAAAAYYSRWSGEQTSSSISTSSSSSSFSSSMYESASSPRFSSSALFSFSSLSLKLSADLSSSPGAFRSSCAFRSCFLCFIRRFWNHVFTWWNGKLMKSSSRNSTLGCRLKFEMCFFKAKKQVRLKQEE